MKFSQDFDFVVRKVRLAKIRALFEHDYGKAVCGKLFCQDSACVSGANDDEVYFVTWFELGPIGIHNFLEIESAGSSECLSAYFAALGQGSDAVGGAECESFNGPRRLAAAGSDKAAAVAQEKIFHVVRAMVGIDDGSFWIAAHAAGSKQMHGELLLFDGIGPLLLGAGGVKDLQAPPVEPFG